MSAVALDDEENVIFTGRKFNASSNLFTLLFGSSGSRSVSARGDTSEGRREKFIASKTLYYNGASQGMNGVLLALTGITLATVLTVLIFALFALHGAKLTRLRSRTHEDKLRYQEEMYLRDIDNRPAAPPIRNVRSHPTRFGSARRCF
jgi:hypothetical protein